MKRMNKNAIALATAGALTLAVAPAAMAEEVTNIDQLNGGDTSLTGNGASVVESNLPTEPEGILTGQNGDPASEPRTPGSEYAERIENGQKQMLFKDANGVALWKRVNDKNQPIDENGNVIEGLTPTLPIRPGEAAGPSAGDIAKAVAALAGAAVGTGIIINGVKYFVNKDKKTLVQDPNRVNAEPSAEEKAKSEEVVKANPDAVASQTGAGNAQAGANNAAAPAANGERGIGASTGVNKLPAGIVSLLLASLLGAAAFVFGRRQLV